MAVTIADIARRVGVTKMTVSNVLADRGGFSAETAQRVRRVAQSLRYRPNAAARAIARRRYGAYALLVGTPSGTRFIHQFLLDGIDSVLSERDNHLLIARLPDEKLTSTGYVPRMLRDWMVDGLLVNYNDRVPERMVTLMEAFDLPAVWINFKREHDTVYPDDCGGGAQAVQRLAALGHRRIAYCDLSTPLNETPWHYSGIDRRKGYEATMRTAGLKPLLMARPHAAVPRDDLATVRQALTRPRRPTAIVAYNPEAITPILHTAFMLGLSVPRDLSVVTFEADAGRALGLSSAYLRIPQFEIGRQAAEMLDRRIALKRRQPGIAMPLTWCAGETVAPPANA